MLYQNQVEQEKEKFLFKISDITNIKFYYVILVYFIIFFVCLSSLSYSYEVNLLDKIKSYFLNLKSMKAKFIQVSPNGDISEGDIFINFPGNLRIDYNKPNDILITSQGFWLKIQDRTIKQTNSIQLKDVPLSLILNKEFDFKKKSMDFKVIENLGLIRFSISDDQNLSYSKLIMEFTNNPLMLKKWTIEDEFNNRTSILLQNVEVNLELPEELFEPLDFSQIEN